ncbi:DUF6048 family protein [Ekhidna sp. To15]|uniref:DUF6048 family protein n=1 Tax=Ekhidna sp. To15 TaxID=3395267 RepID=UPI003F5284D4
MLKSIFSISAWIIGLVVLGQPAPPKKVKEPVDFRPYEVKIGVNAIRGIRTLSGSENLTTHEFQTAVAIHKYNLVFDFGIEEHKRGESFAYENKGSYYRIGFDRNFTKDKASGNVLSLGLRYARASFEDQLLFTADKGYGEQDYLLENNALTARWLEVAFALRGRIVSNLYMGFTMRWQFLRQINGEGELKAFDIPGFGKTKRQNSTAFDYYLAWRIPFN